MLIQFPSFNHTPCQGKHPGNALWNDSKKCTPSEHSKFPTGNFEKTLGEHSIHWVAASQGAYAQVDSIVIPAPGSAWDGEQRTCERPEGSTGLLAAELRTGLGIRPGERRGATGRSLEGCCQGEIIHFSISVVENRVNNNLKLEQVQSLGASLGFPAPRSEWDVDQGKFIPLKHQRCVCAYRC